MATEREVPKLVKCPSLTPELIAKLTSICFRPDNKPIQSSVIFVFGNIDRQQTALIVRDLLISNISKTVIISGGSPDFGDHNVSRTISEAKQILEFINPRDFPNVKFDIEEDAHNTKENVVYGVRRFGLDKYQNICYIFLSHMSQRGYLTLRKYLPTQNLFQVTFPRTDPETNTPLSAQRWHESEGGRNRVWAEVLRIKLYGQRNDIAYPEEISNLINSMEF